MNQDTKNRLKRTALLSLIALLVGGGMAVFQISNEAAQSVRKSSTAQPMAGVAVGGPFALSDHTGASVTEGDYAGQYKLIYFGFTYCPAICPTELQKISKVMKKLGARAEAIQPLFITIDPARDTAPVMREYVTLFHPKLVGLTGSQAEIDTVLKSYRVFASRVDDPENNDYTMDHSSFIYLMSPDDQLISMYRIKDDAGYMVKDIQARLGNS